jgi:hypothetical protein
MTAGELSTSGRVAASREPGRAGNGARRRRGEGRGERSMVPPAQFRSYYGRPIMKAPV